MTKRTHILVAAGCALALLLAGCGSDKEGKELPKSSVAALQTQLDSIQSRVEKGACRDVTDGGDPNTSVVQQQINALPSDVDKDVRDALTESFQNLFQLVKDQCEPTTTPTETETTPTVTETVPTVTETVPTETTTTETTTTPEKQKKDKKGKGGGDGAGGGGTEAPGGE